MVLSFGMGMELRQEMKYRLDQSQKLQLGQLQKISDSLTHEEFPNAKKGLEGIFAAAEVLNENRACGVLIGGLLKTIYDPITSEKDLMKHKDVDVLLLDNLYTPKEKFEHGIDWWVPTEKKIDIVGEYSKVLGAKTKFWKNGNDIILSYGLKSMNILTPGLYIPTIDSIVEMREAETYANIGRGFEYDANVDSEFKESIENSLDSEIPYFIYNNLNVHVFKEDHINDYGQRCNLEVETFQRDILSEIKSKY
ncbi:hypothetical protein HOD61_00965 [archaeon]|jgi:hypothetical protein|nr:hypothetical protein [archaeon]